MIKSSSRGEFKTMGNAKTAAQKSFDFPIAKKTIAIEARCEFNAISRLPCRYFDFLVAINPYHCGEYRKEAYKCKNVIHDMLNLTYSLQLEVTQEAISVAPDPKILSLFITEQTEKCRTQDIVREE